jgi:nicotinate-nucleotide pyrophosphorylase (carboxylating)
MPMIPPPIDLHTLELIRLAVREDMGDARDGQPWGDKTVELSIPRELHGQGTIVARKPGTVSGTFLLEPILREYQGDTRVEIQTFDGGRVVPDQPVATITGQVGTILSAERVLLNFLGHLSGIATMTRRYVDAIESVDPPPFASRPVICDTRKTTPAFRALDKYAVRCGGGVNHRMGLYDGVMLKDNHLAALRARLGADLSLAEWTAQIRRQLDPAITLWLEVDTLKQLGEALSGDQPGADIILLDNFNIERTREAVLMRNRAAHSGKCGRRASAVLLESSGGITLENVAAVAQTGVDRISIGALTHSAPVLDLSMEWARGS